MIQFIHQDPKNRSLSESDRRIVRKVSNRAAARTRKAKGLGTKVNTLQLPDFLIASSKAPPGAATVTLVDSDGSTTSADSEPPTTPLTKPRFSRALMRRDDYTSPIPPPLSLWPNNTKCPEYVALLMQPGLSQKLLVDASGAPLNSDPRRWVKICRLTSILQFLPPMIGHSKCLDCAIDCLAERVRQCCVTSPDLELAQGQLEMRYGRALQLLQTSLNRPQSIDWTVWYTTLLLALFEVGYPPLAFSDIAILD
jgi:hypothetical protein